MTLGAALLRGVLDEPDEDAPRLVYADWLAENGQEAWGEFIQVQCRLAREEPGYSLDMRHSLDVHEHSVNPDIRLALELLRKADHTYPGPQPFVQLVLYRMVEYRRGLIESVTLSGDDWLKHAKDWLAHWPIRNIRLSNWPMVGIHQVVENNAMRNKYCFQARPDLGDLPNNQISSLRRRLSELWPGVKFRSPWELAKHGSIS